MKRLIQLVGVTALGLAVAGAAAAQQPPQGHGMLRQACATDVQKLCPDAKPGPGGGIRQCIMSHQDQLSDGCKTALAEMRQRWQERGGPGGGEPGGPGGGNGSPP